jgi:hypothetical protein
MIGNKTWRALGRLKSGQMNATELRYSKTLELKKQAGEILWYHFEGLRFRLADATGYTPDFIVMTSTGQLEAHEVKGAKAIFQDDAKVKIKVAASMYPIRFIVVFPIKKSNLWEVVEY